MECQTSDSKKLLKVFDASKRKRSRKKREEEVRSAGPMRSVASDESTSQSCQTQVRAKCSLQDVCPSNETTPKRNESPSMTQSHSSENKGSSSPHRHRRHTRDYSLALKTRQRSTPRSISPPQEGEAPFESAAIENNSFVYTFVEEAIKREKRKQRHARRKEERASRVRASPSDHRDDDRHDHHDHHDQHDRRDHRSHRVREDRDQVDSHEQRDERDYRHHRRSERKEPEKLKKEEHPAPVIDPNALIETFAKLCATLNTKIDNSATNNVHRALSHKSLQCESVSKQTCCNDMDHRPVKLRGHENSQDNIPAAKIRSQEDNRERTCSRDNIPMSRMNLNPVKDKSTYYLPYDKETSPRERYSSRLDFTGSTMMPADDRDYAPRPCPTRSCLDQAYRHNSNDLRGYTDQNVRREQTRDCHYRRDNREYDQEARVYDRIRPPNKEKSYDDETRRCIDQKTSRSFDVPRTAYVDDRLWRAARSDIQKIRSYDESRYYDRNRQRLYEDAGKRDKYYEDRPLVTRDQNKSRLLRDNRERRNKKYMERFERASVTSREEDYKEKDRLSERERDSGLSVADAESTASARSNYLRIIKQEIGEQRENMDAMMNLWKDLMRCFKNTSQNSGSERAATESAANNARESAATQLRLWRECMRRYETVARDVGDTDARLMEEINKQRSEMAEMASMWQECLHRYREMSSDFNNLKQKLVKSASSVPPMVPTVCAEGESPAPPVFHQPTYQTPPLPAPVPGYGCGGGCGSPVRARASAPAPPPWWWGEAAQAAQARVPRARRSSPDSRGSRDRDRHRHRDRDREDSRHKEKSKPSAARSEHRRRKR